MGEAFRWSSEIQKVLIRTVVELISQIVPFMVIILVKNSPPTKETWLLWTLLTGPIWRLSSVVFFHFEYALVVPDACLYELSVFLVRVVLCGHMVAAIADSRLRADIHEEIV